MSLFGGDTYSILRYLVNFLGTLGMLLSLNEYKYPPKRLALCFGLYGVWFFYCTVIMLRYGDYSRIFFVMLSLAIMVPGVILSYLLGRATVPQAVFNYVTQIDLSILLSLPFGLLRDDIGEYWGIDIFYRALLYLIVIYLEREHLQPVFRNLTHAVKSGWWSLALIPVTFLILIAMLGYYPRYYVDYPTMTYYLLAAEATMIMVYVVIVRSLLRQYQMEGVSRDMDLLRLQNSGLTARAEASRIAEEQIRIARHDLRHKLLAVAALLEKDDKEAALRYIGASVENLEKMRPPAVLQQSDPGRGILLLLRTGRTGRHPDGAVPGDPGSAARQHGGAVHGVCQRHGERHPCLPKAPEGGAGHSLQVHLQSPADVQDLEPLFGRGPL